MPRPPEPDAGGRGVRLLRRPENALPLQALGDPAYAIRRDRPTKSPSPSPVRASHRLGAQEASIPIVGGVVVRAHVDPAGVRDDVVDAVGHGPAQLAVGEVMGADPHWLASRLPFTAVVLEGTDQFLLRVHTDHRSPAVLVSAGLLVEVVELRVTVGVLLALQGLG
jgi:hypothetical protein